MTYRLPELPFDRTAFAPYLSLAGAHGMLDPGNA